LFTSTQGSQRRRLTWLAAHRRFRSSSATTRPPPCSELSTPAALAFSLLRSAGFNHVDVAEAERLGLTIARVPAYSPYAVAEHAVGLMLTLNRKFHRAYARVREQNFALDGLMGFDMHGKTAGVIGTGKIGEAVCAILRGFGCRVLAFDPVKNPACEAFGVEYVPLTDLYARVRHHLAPLPAHARDQAPVNAAALAAMKPGVMLINTSRGAVIDTRALIAALKRGHVGSVGLDVYEEEGDLFFKDLSAGGDPRRRLRAAADLPQRAHHRPPGLLHARGVRGHRADDHRQRDWLCARRYQPRQPRHDPARRQEVGWLPSERRRHRRRRALGPRPLLAACVDPAGHVDGGFAALARLELGADSSTSRSWCVSRPRTSTIASGRDDGAGAGLGEVSRTVIPISARSALVVLGYPCTKLVTGRTSFSSAARAASLACRAAFGGGWAATCAGNCRVPRAPELP
jgi:lactate dehydrogenase-like 2-hydroxyacid dehydrogenase